jgi:hypothetical protein
LNEENTSNVTGNANIRFEKYGWKWGERGRGQIEGPQEPGKEDKMVHSTYC